MGLYRICLTSYPWPGAVPRRSCSATLAGRPGRVWRDLLLDQRKPSENHPMNRERSLVLDINIIKGPSLQFFLRYPRYARLQSLFCCGPITHSPMLLVRSPQTVETNIQREFVACTVVPFMCDFQVTFKCWNKLSHHIRIRTELSGKMWEDVANIG